MESSRMQINLQIKKVVMKQKRLRTSTGELLTLSDGLWPDNPTGSNLTSTVVQHFGVRLTYLSPTPTPPQAGKTHRFVCLENFPYEYGPKSFLRWAASLSGTRPFFPFPPIDMSQRQRVPNKTKSLYLVCQQRLLRTVRSPGLRQKSAGGSACHQRDKWAGDFQTHLTFVHDRTDSRSSD